MSKVEDIGYKARWSEKEISELIIYSNDVLEVEIPLATDIYCSKGKAVLF